MNLNSTGICNKTEIFKKKFKIETNNDPIQPQSQYKDKHKKLTKQL